jgi:hypothetical protein
VLTQWHAPRYSGWLLPMSLRRRRRLTHFLSQIKISLGDVTGAECNLEPDLTAGAIILLWRLE